MWYYVQNPLTGAIRDEQAEPIPSDYVFQIGTFEGVHGIGTLYLDSSVLDDVQQIEEEPQRVSLRMLATMQDLLKAVKVDLDWYKVPSAVKVDQKNKAKVSVFNTMLDTLAGQKIAATPFVVTINIGDLKGNGDITAGAKLARQLNLFFQSVEEWKNTSVRLYLHKISNLEEQGVKQKNEMARVIQLAQSILEGTSVKLVNLPLEEKSKGKEQEKEKLQEVDFAYAATNLAGVAFSVSQYGYDQFSGDFHQYGSGPGYGCLGVLPVTNEQQVHAITAYHKQEDALLQTITRVNALYKIERFHFGYFSIYDTRPKTFVRRICEASKAQKIGFALVRSADSLSALGQGLAGEGNIVHVVKIDKTGKINKTEEFLPPKGKISKRDIVLLDLFEGVTPTNMLSLYYGSDDPVGATGDQSFVEAYIMRSEKNVDKSKASSDETPDLLYDVAEQQAPLRNQLNELASGTINFGKRGQAGLNEIRINQVIEQIMKKKNLLFPILLLINYTLNTQK